MTDEEKRQKILDAVSSGKFSKRQIDPKGKGRSIKRLEDGQGIGDEKLEELYARLVELEKDGEKNKQTTTNHTIKRQTDKTLSKQTTDEGLRDKIEEQGKIITSQQERIARMESRLVQLEDELNKLKQANEQLPIVNKYEQTHKQTILGFSIKETTTKSKGNTYRVYKAFRCVDGIPMPVYIGHDPDQAREKILAYLKKNREKLSGVISVILAENPGLEI